MERLSSQGSLGDWDYKEADLENQSPKEVIFTSPVLNGTNTRILF